MALLRDAAGGSDPIRLILVDARMPETDGFSLVREIKGASGLGSTVIMMLSSSDGADEIRQCEDLGSTPICVSRSSNRRLFDAIVLALGIEAVEDEGPGQRPPCAVALRILLAEDSLVNQKLAIGLLSREGHTVVVARDGREAVASVAAEQFDLVLMDVQMPEMDGLEAAEVDPRAGSRHRQTRADHRHDRARQKGDRQRCLDAEWTNTLPSRSGSIN